LNFADICHKRLTITKGPATRGLEIDDLD
jgi:hypothetical protein